MAVARGALLECLAGLFTYVAMVTSLVCPNGLLSKSLSNHTSFTAFSVVITIL